MSGPTRKWMKTHTLQFLVQYDLSFIAVWTGAPSKCHGLNEEVCYCFLFSLVIPTYTDRALELCVQREYNCLSFALETC